ncbi:MAG TPA: helix-turn-helix domain-containing protein [Syntrophorhabdaceae bacterium]|jgi:DNA-binding protein Fis
MLIGTTTKIKPNDSEDISHLIKVKLEHVVDSLLASKGRTDNILLDVHQTIEKIFICSAMRLKNDNVTQAAKLLGISRNTLSKKLREINGNGNSD